MVRIADALARAECKLGLGDPVAKNLSCEIDGGLKASAGWLPKPAQLEMISHPVHDVVVRKTNANIRQRQACEFGNGRIGVRPDLRLTLPIGDKNSFR
jgi:hypothetical protein